MEDIIFEQYGVCVPADFDQCTIISVPCVVYVDLHTQLALIFAVLNLYLVHDQSKNYKYENVLVTRPPS